ncbi:carbamoyl phosphate synthase small subunit [Companilactobacillus sp. DQM5]|uniref:carbamoyl phosphate synthase small subunit n=1 Tax=Companilactobacillus sp. DQM5 TaxID=3463359 RepID=UPI004059313D
MKRYLVLEDGFTLEGDSIGAPIVAAGQLVISNNLYGLEQTLTDATYNGQIIAMTVPAAGATGINANEYESIDPTCKGIIFNSVALSNETSKNQSLDEFLKKKDIPGITNIDTRALSRHVQKYGQLKASISDTDDEHSVDQIKALVIQRDLVKQVSTRQPYPNPNSGKKIIVIDLGMKYSILRQLSYRDCNSIVVPYNYSAQQIRELKPDGIVISNGPGNPQNIQQTINTVSELQEEFPIFAIGLGHLVIALANECQIITMKLGHHSTSYPVKEIASGKIEYTNHNHIYAISNRGIKDAHFIVTHICPSDGTIEGIRHMYKPTISVQFDPEAAPGAQDMTYLFDEFIDMINSYERI